MNRVIRVLHVDDDPAFADLTATYLERVDDRFAVETATSASEGLERLVDDEFDCIVSDYEMPHQNGIEFLESVRAADPDLPFILYTGRGSEEIAGDAISAGVSGYMQKESGTDQYTVLAQRISNAAERQRAQARAEQAERRAQTILDSSPNPILVAVDESLVYANSAAVELFNASSEAELVARSIIDLTHPDHQAEVAEAVKPLQAGDRTVTRIRRRAQTIDGQGIPVEVTARNIAWDGENGVVAIISDVSEREERRRALEASEARYRSLTTDVLDTSEVGTFILNSDFEVVWINEAIERYFGIDREAILGTDKRRLIEEEIAGIFEDSPTFAETVLATYDDNTYTEQFECHVISNDDREDRWLEHWSQPIEFGLYEGGRIEHYTDITERKEQEREQKATIEFLRSLYDVSTAAELDFEEKVSRLLAVGCEKLDLPYGFLTRIEIDERHPNGGTQTIVESIGDHELLQPEKSCPLSHAYCRKTIDTDGLLAIQDVGGAGWENDPAYETFNLGSYIGARVVVDEELYGTICFASSIPRDAPFSDAERTFVRLMSNWASYELERVRATREVEQQNERLERFASVVSHDLRNPLNVAQGRLELAHEACDSPHLDDAADAVDRSLSLIDELLALAREGNRATDPGTVDLAEMVEGCWQNVETADATLVAAADQTIEADPNRLKQLLENLLRNAVVHGGEDVTITVGDLTDGFYVADDGPGIPSSEREQVFEAGYTTRHEGTGFGLNIVREIIDAHGWRVDITDSETGGARFEITDVAVVDVVRTRTDRR